MELQRTIAADLVDRQFVPVLEALRLAHSHLDMPALLLSHNKDAKKIEAVMIDIAAK